MPAQPRDLTGTRRRRRRVRAIRMALRGLIVVAVLALIAGVGWVVGFSPVLSATRVDVRGTSVLTSDQVVEAAQVPLGTPLARLDTKPLSARVTALPPVSTVTISRGWPNSVVITVVERQPVFVLKGADGSYSLVDARGTAYFRMAEAPAGLIVATATSHDERVLRDIATVVVALPASVREHVALVNAESVDRIVLHLDGGRQVMWGSAEQSETKGRVAEALLKVKASVYDVSAPSHPATRA